MKTKQQIKNLKDALHNMWPSVPEANVFPGLRDWSDKGVREGENEGYSPNVTCNTVCCFGGWCAVWPNFRDQDLVIGCLGMPELKDAYYVTPGAIAHRLFGDPAMFVPRGMHHADYDFEGTDHALVTNRLKWALKHKELSE